MSRPILCFIAFSLAALVWAVNRIPTMAQAQPLPGQPAVSCLLPPGPGADGDPLQSEVPAAMRAFRQGEFVISPLAGFSLEARVLSREDYRFGAESALSPTDLALGWRQMAIPDFYERLDISQSGRWYFYRWGSEGPPLPPDEIIRSSANMHLIPSGPAVAEALSQVRAGQSVRVQGWLVEARRDDGWLWRSSLTREDSGDGSCELVYVCALATF